MHRSGPRSALLHAIVSAWPGLSKGICGRHGPDRWWFAVFLLALSALLLASHGLTLAQQVPPTVEPGTIQKRLERAPKPKAAPPIDIPDTGRLTPPPGAEEIRFVLTDVWVEGNTVYTEEELLPLWEGLLGQEITLTQFYGIAAAITIRYRNDGYILSRAFVPPQEIIDGFTDIEVIEGYIDNVVVEGDPSGPAAQIEDKIEAIKASQPLRAPDRGKFHNCGTQHALNLEEGTLSWPAVPGAPSRL